MASAFPVAADVILDIEHFSSHILLLKELISHYLQCEYHRCNPLIAGKFFSALTRFYGNRLVLPGQGCWLTYCQTVAYSYPPDLSGASPAAAIPAALSLDWSIHRFSSGQRPAMVFVNLDPSLYHRSGRQSGKERGGSSDAARIAYEHALVVRAYLRQIDL